jgi:D-tyrosyl-tRNA(Tyr) deacylase
MIALIQRVNSAKVIIGKSIHSQISKGLLIFLAIGKNDSESDSDYLISKIKTLKIFSDSEGELSKNIAEAKKQILVVSQFTLYADLKKGHTPSFSNAMRPSDARFIYDSFCDKLKMTNIPVETGVFGAKMQIELINDGPVTLILKTDNLKDVN